jgi:hypothetical protein
MKRRILAITVLLSTFLFISSCKEQPSPPPGAHQNPAGSSEPALPARSAVPSDSEVCGSLLPVLVGLENELRANSRSWETAHDLAKASFDTASGCFLAAGKGTFNRSHPQAAWEIGRKMAAEYDARQWALYLKARALGRDISFGERVSGEITYAATMCQQAAGDTLFVLLKVPTGSIIVR